MKRFLWPHMAILLVLTPLSLVWLVYALLYCSKGDFLAIAAYVLSAYTLTLWCVRVPQLVQIGKRFKTDSRYWQWWQADIRRRTRVTLFLSFLWNVAYGVFQLALGLYHRSFWFGSLAVYYLTLALVRVYLSRRARPERAKGEQWRAYRTCGWVFLGLNLTLSLMVFFMIYWNRTFHHHPVTAIAMAAYTFTSFTVAVVGLLRYRRHENPVLSAGKALSLAAAAVSMLTLESTMLTTFGAATLTPAARRWFLALTGGAVSLFLVVLAVSMLRRARKILKKEQPHA